MGYTHYWSFNKYGNSQEREKKYQQAIKDCQKVTRYIYNKMDVKLSGYTAHCKIGQYGGLFINGKGDDSHEDFIMREHYNQNEGNFCKTARKPYDLAVTACLAIMKYRLGDNINVGSDGDSDEWSEGVEIAKKVLKRKIQVPV